MPAVPNVDLRRLVVHRLEATRAIIGLSRQVADCHRNIVDRLYTALHQLQVINGKTPQLIRAKSGKQHHVKNHTCDNPRGFDFSRAGEAYNSDM